MTKFGLSPTESDRWTRNYDPELNAGITNAFAAAAYRFGHTLIQGNIQYVVLFINEKHHNANLE